MWADRWAERQAQWQADTHADRDAHPHHDDPAPSHQSQHEADYTQSASELAFVRS